MANTQKSRLESRSFPAANEGDERKNSVGPNKNSKYAIGDQPNERINSNIRIMVGTNGYGYNKYHRRLRNVSRNPTKPRVTDPRSQLKLLLIASSSQLPNEVSANFATKEVLGERFAARLRERV